MAEVALFISQYSVMLSSTSSFVGVLAGSCHTSTARSPDARESTLRCRRVGRADRLRPDGQHREIGRAVRLAVRVERVEHSAFLLGESRGRGSADSEGRAHVGPHGRRQIDEDAQQSCGSLARHLARDGRAPVATLGDVARVREALHQLRPGSPDVVRVPTGAGWLAGEAAAR